MTAASEMIQRKPNSIQHREYILQIHRIFIEFLDLNRLHESIIRPPPDCGVELVDFLIPAHRMLGGRSAWSPPYRGIHHRDDPIIDCLPICLMHDPESLRHAHLTIVVDRNELILSSVRYETLDDRVCFRRCNTLGTHHAEICKQL